MKKRSRKSDGDGTIKSIKMRIHEAELMVSILQEEEEAEAEEDEEEISEEETEEEQGELEDSIVNETAPIMKEATISSMFNKNGAKIPIRT